MYINDFAKSLELKNASNLTISNYMMDLNKFYNHINISEESNESEMLNKITMLDLEKYTLSLKSKGGRSGKGESVRTINRRIASLKSYFKYLTKHDIITKNIAFFLDSMKVPDVSPIYLSLEERNSLIKATKIDRIGGRMEEHSSIRNELMIRIYSTYGLRNTELINLKETDIDLENGRMRVLGKGNKERYMYISESELMLYKEYLEIKRIVLKDYDDNVFVSNNGKKLDISNIGRIIKKCVAESNISNDTKDKITPHKLRHTAATLALKSGVELSVISKILGHKDTGITSRVYIHIDDEDVRNACGKISG